jgi:tetratricopeptide (TPR) repeat protein
VTEMSAQATLTSVLSAGFDEELARAEKEIVRLQSRLNTSPCDLQTRVRLLYRMNHRASLTGRMSDLEALDAAAADAIRELGPKEDLCLLKANLDAHLHRNAEARLAIESAPLLSSRYEARSLLADLDFQEGRYEAAQSALRELIGENPAWDNLARLAHWESKLGDPAEADELYLQAQDELTAKQMRSYAWLELQRGMIDFRQGRLPEARKHYRRADESYSGYWLTDEHFAELCAAEGDFEKAEALLGDVVARTGKPELQQAIGELCLLAGRREEALSWFEQALALYLESVGRGRVHYYHHLCDFFGDARPDPAEALLWARRDFALRSNFSTQTALAWAYYLNGQLGEALPVMAMALSSGVRDAMIFGTAAELYAAAGDSAASRMWKEAAMQINPRGPSFHIHH